METTSGDSKRYPGTELIKLEKQVEAMSAISTVATTLDDLRPLELQRTEAMRELMHAFRETRDLTGYVTVGTEDAEAGIFPAPLDRPYRDEAGDTLKRMYVVLTLQGFKAIEFVRDLSAQNVDEEGRPMPTDFDDRSVQNMIRDITTRESGVRGSFQIYADLDHRMTIPLMGYLKDLDLGAGLLVVKAIEASMKERSHSLEPEKIKETTQIAQKLRGIFK